MLTKEFIHIHIPRTGGQMIRMMVDHILPKGEIHHWNMTHSSVKEARAKLIETFDEDTAAKAVSFCFVRNPWDWYVSRYFFRNQRSRWQGEEIVPADFCGDGPEGFRKHMDILMECLDKGVPVPNEAGQPAATRTYIPITLSGWHDKLTEGGVDRVGRFENFVPDLVGILTSCSRIPAVDIQNIAGPRKVNSSRHRNYRDYYDDELKQWVAEQDAAYIEKFGYEF